MTDAAIAVPRNAAPGLLAEVGRFGRFSVLGFSLLLPLAGAATVSTNHELAHCVSIFVMGDHPARMRKRQITTETMKLTTWLREHLSDRAQLVLVDVQGAFGQSNRHGGHLLEEHADQSSRHVHWIGVDTAARGVT